VCRALQSGPVRALGRLGITRSLRRACRVSPWRSSTACKIRCYRSARRSSGRSPWRANLYAANASGPGRFECAGRRGGPPWTPRPARPSAESRAIVLGQSDGASRALPPGQNANRLTTGRSPEIKNGDHETALLDGGDKRQRQHCAPADGDAILLRRKRFATTEFDAQTSDYQRPRASTQNP
jgi:hypothetical protein